jgi:hypothetical protein
MSRSLARTWPLVLAVVLLALPASAEVFHVTLTNGSVVETAYQPQQASWDSGLVLFLTDQGNWIGVQKDEIESIRAEDPTQGFGIRISDKTISLGLAPNDLPEEGSQTRQDRIADRYYELTERALALAEKQQNYSIQQGVATEQTQGIPASFGGYGNGLDSGGLGGGTPPSPAPSPSPAPLPGASNGDNG